MFEGTISLYAQKRAVLEGGVVGATHPSSTEGSTQIAADLSAVCGG